MQLIGLEYKVHDAELQSQEGERVQTIRAAFRNLSIGLPIPAYSCFQVEHQIHRHHFTNVLGLAKLESQPPCCVVMEKLAVVDVAPNHCGGPVSGLPHYAALRSAIDRCLRSQPISLF